jgi:ribosome biogenesis GTPase
MLRAVRAGRASRPVVGDWVSVSPDGIVEALRPRRTKLARKAAGLHDVEQVLVANLDLAFIASAAGADVNERRLERYLALVHEGGATPVLLLTKMDTCADPERELDRLRRLAPDLDRIAVSARTGQGIDEVARRIPRGTLAVLVGSSGVGKSTLVNRLVGEDLQRVGGLRDDGKGRHTTTRRAIVELPGGGLLADTPGMRELGLIDAGEGLGEAFPEITAAAGGCRFRDCRHESEPGCAVRDAVERGGIEPERLASWRKLDEENRARARRGR